MYKCRNYAILIINWYSYEWGDNVGIIDSVLGINRFNDTIFYKENSDLQDRYDALEKLEKEYPNNADLLNELIMVKKGLSGENEIAYQLKKANIGMYVLRDIKVKFKDMTAQIDYIVITPVFVYYIECKNLFGNITVTDKGDFIREYTLNGKKVKKGMYSPLRQVEAQREVLRKIWLANASAITKIFSAKNFDYYRRVLVVVANQDTILNTNRAPKDIKHKVIRADALVKQIQYDLAHKSESDYYNSKKDMEVMAQGYMDLDVKEEVNYYECYREKYCKNTMCVLKEKSNALREQLIDFRKTRATEMKIPAYYIFNNDELDKLVELRPKSLKELNEMKILSPIKVKTHGENIIAIINN